MDFANLVNSDHQAVQFLPQPSSDLDSSLALLDLKDDDVDWLELPEHVLSLVIVKLIRLDDYIRFSAVCRSCHSVAIENRHLMVVRQPPLLMLATQFNNDDQTRSFYSLTDNEVVDFCVPVPHDLCMRGSSHGWLAMVSKNWDITLHNPFLSVNNKIPLPPATAFEPRINKYGNTLTAISFDDFMKFVGKVVLSANPASNPNYVAMAIYGDLCRVAFFKPGDKAWTSLDSKCIYIDDVIYYEDQFYFVDCEGRLFSCDMNHPQLTISTVAPARQPTPLTCKWYLVESCGELWQVCRLTMFANDVGPTFESDNSMDYHNFGFKVFKLNRGIKAKWIKMNNLHGCVFFLGDNSSYSVCVSDFPECKPNSIYFTDDYYEAYRPETGLGPHDMGVFNVEKRTHEPHYPTNAKTHIPAPIWVERTV